MHRRQAKQTFVFPVEIRGVVVANAEGSAGRVESFTEHESPGFLMAQPLLELQGAHCDDSFEVVELHRPE